MAAPAKKTVELFYDVISPYSWLAFEVLCRYQKKWNMDLQLKPFFLGGVMKGSENKPPGVVPAKAAYMQQDIQNLRKYYSVPINFLSNPAETLFVKGSMAAQRLLVATQMTHPHLLEQLSRELWMRIWNKDLDITTPESLADAGKRVGLTDTQIAELLKRSKEEPVKERLKKVTQDALDQGAFGAPFIIAHDAQGKKHIVFGSDRMHIVAMLLGEKYEGPLTELAQSKL